MGSMCRQWQHRRKLKLFPVEQKTQLKVPRNQHKTDQPKNHKDHHQLVFHHELGTFFQKIKEPYDILLFSFKYRKNGIQPRHFNKA